MVEEKLALILHVLDRKSCSEQCCDIAGILEEKYKDSPQKGHWRQICSLLRIEWPDAMKIIYELAFIMRDELYSSAEGRTVWYIACNIVEAYQYRGEIVEPKQFLGTKTGVLAKREVGILRQSAIVWVVTGLIAGIANG